MAFSLVLTAFGAVTIFSVVQHERTARSLRLLHEGYLPLALTLGEAKATQAVFATLLDRLRDEDRDTGRTQSWLNAARQARPATLRRVFHGLENAERLAPDPTETARVREELQEVETTFRETNQAYDDLFAAFRGGEEAEARQLLVGVEQREHAIQRNYRDAWRAIQERIATTSAEAGEQERSSAVILGVMTIAALMLGIIATWWSQRVLKPLPRLYERVASVAQGDLSRVMEDERDDELGRLSNEFERMVDALATRDTRLRGLQQLQEQILGNLRAAILVVEDGRLRLSNAAAARVLAVDETSEGVNMDALAIGELAEFTDAVERAGNGGDPVTLDAQPFRDRVLDVLVTPFGDRDTVLVVADDVTDALSTKARLIHSERLAAIGRMAAHVTHEVRNPLSSIGLNVEMLGDEIGAGNAEAAALMRAIQDEIDRLAGITEEYLRLARLPQPLLEPEDLGELLESVALFVAREMEASRIELTLNIDEELPTVALDEPQLRQALINLLRNAREAMPGGGEITVTCAAADDVVSVSVRDQGDGVDEAARAMIFDLFFTTKDHGTGLGLPLTRQIVVAHGGDIECVVDDEGTTFTFWLPAAKSEAVPKSA